MSDVIYNDRPYQIINVETPPASIDLMTLEEMKAMLIGVTSTATDAQIQFIITSMSAALAKLVNRVFGFQKVHETFYNLPGWPRIYFSQWPVKFEDIESLTVNGVDILPDLTWSLEESTGTLYWPGGSWSGTVDAVYSGGYHLPDEAPFDLKAVANTVMREAYYNYQRGMLASGVRMLSHKGNRIQFHSPTGERGSSGGTVSSATWNSAKATLDHYFRHWI